MNDRTRLKRLNRQLDLSESELSRLSHEIDATDDLGALEDLNRLRNLAQARADALQAEFDADFEPRAQNLA